MFGIVEEYRRYSYAAFTSRFMCWNAVRYLRPVMCCLKNDWFYVPCYIIVKLMSP
jgi:hypothetical protein